MINLDNCDGSRDAVDDLSTKTYVLSKTKDLNVKVFNMITNKNKAKQWSNIFMLLLTQIQ